MSKVWVVSSKGDPKGDSWELSVVVKGTHGERSYGWASDEKYMVWHEGGPCRETAHPALIDDYFALANKLADKLNAEANQ